MIPDTNTSDALPITIVQLSRELRLHLPTRTAGGLQIVRFASDHSSLSAAK
jgi:hypothetical protein